MKRLHYYKVLYSDGVKQLDLIQAANIKEAKKIAATRAKGYETSYYMVARCYEAGIRESSGITYWH